MIITKPTIGDEHKGYTVHEVYHTQHESIVIAKSDTAPAPWVCWSWSQEAGYYAGCYYETADQATMRMAQRITRRDITTLAAAEGAIMAAMDKLGINYVDDILAMIDHDLTTPAKLTQLEQLAEGWRIP